ncbi:MAG TPA: HPr family phosphocarrier protein [Bacteroidales bacterium]|nr:HPr family phosphocarrier protein [Bacteroidales bacterium]HPT21736.1 HPr family phosphocarrier protein [Bacteroidales bacterium]
MISKDYVIFDPHGMHARPATALLKLTRQYKSVFSLKKDGKLIQMKSMLNILSLTVKCGDTISAIVEGEDEKEASYALDAFFNEEMKKF